MDWQKIWLLLDIMHKAQNVPYTDNIRAEAMAELAGINSGSIPQPQLQPELDLKPEARRI